MTNEPEAVKERLRRHVTALSVEIGERTSMNPASLAHAAGYVGRVFEGTGLRVDEQSYEYRGARVVNLVATRNDERDPRAYYLVGAHYDTVPGTPGADDNASGVAVLLELAHAVASGSLGAPVRLAAFTLEEPPAFMTRNQGSRVFVRRLAETGDRILGAIILEMVGYTSPRQRYPFVLRFAGYPRAGDYIGIIGNWRSRRFGRTVLRGFRGNPDLPVESLFVPLNGWLLPATRLSDHASFWDSGLPAVMVTDTAFMRNPNYHLPWDTVETLDFDFMTQLVRSLELALAELPAASG
ncbi:MAG: M28 family peptidase [Alphaproteobacteria bacterium]